MSETTTEFLDRVRAERLARHKALRDQVYPVVLKGVRALLKENRDLTERAKADCDSRQLRRLFENGAWWTPAIARDCLGVWHEDWKYLSKKDQTAVVRRALEALVREGPVVRAIGADDKGRERKEYTWKAGAL